MKKVLAVILCLICAQLSFADEIESQGNSASQKQVEQFRNDNVPFIYESRAKLPAANEKLAEYMSADYRETKDEFTRHEMMEKMLPIIKSSLEEARASSEYTVRVGTELGQYDFDNKSFPSGITSDTYISFNNSKYAVIFENGNELKNIRTPLDQAKSLSSKLQNNRNVAAVLLCKVIGVQEKKVRNYWDVKFIRVKVVKAVFLADDAPFATIVTKQ